MDVTVEDIKLGDYCQIDSNASDSETEAKLRVFIKLIGNEPAIFNPKHEDYRSNSAKDVLWSNISKRVGWTERFCKTKWKALRNQYCRELKRVRSNSKAVIKWQYFQSLKFLRPYALHRDYRIRVPNRPAITNEYVNEKEINAKQSSTSQEWNSCNQSGLVNESADVGTQHVQRIIQADSIGVLEEEEPQDEDDDDDDPIHTFLRIESYFEKQLITMVESEDVLYNHQNPLYRNPKVKMSTWDEIARKLKRTSMQCRIKWKSLRDQYIREHKRIMSTSNKNFMTRWKHYDSLRFLENFIRVKNCNLDNSNIVKEELSISMDNIDQEAMNVSSSDAQYIIGEDETTQTLGDCDHSKEGTEVEIDEENTHFTLTNENRNDLPVAEVPESRVPTHNDDDEVGSFFKAVAIKIRKANMSTMAFTELQIDILKVITDALRKPN